MILTLMRHGVSDRNILLARREGEKSWLANEPTTVPAEEILHKHDGATRLAPCAGKYIDLAVDTAMNDMSFATQDVAYVSPFRRALETYRLAANRAGIAEWVPAKLEPLVVERDWGIHDISLVDEYGYLNTEMLAFVKKSVHGRKTRSDYVKTVNGESHVDVVSRAATFLTLLQGRPEKNVLVVSHAEYLGELARLATNSGDKFHFSNSQITRIDTVGRTVSWVDPIRNETGRSRFDELDSGMTVDEAIARWD